ncbi:hypothetical protein [Pseudomonas sp. CF161]|uniref:hypothetical protein n=1 Tax=Pseudomonas sp. CF161 TaxID=911241 RepID=UPI0012EC0C06|nr:hypothetical protein [Pseudomonas sp. CF161]
MQGKLDINSKTRKWLVILAFLTPGVTYGDKASPNTLTLSAGELSSGCSNVFKPMPATLDEESLGAPSTEINVSWICDGAPEVLVDTYKVEGGSPDVFTTFVREKETLVVCAKWHICSRASDFCGDLYRVFLYRYTGKGGIPQFKNSSFVLGRNKAD